jgi:hypothetical protein
MTDINAYLHPVMAELQELNPKGDWMPQDSRLSWVLALHEEGHSARASGEATGVSDTQNTAT